MNHPNRLKELRQQSRLTQKEVAKLLDADVTTISRHESGDRPIPHEMVERYRSLYKVASYELFMKPTAA